MKTRFASQLSILLPLFVLSACGPRPHGILTAHAPAPNAVATSTPESVKADTPPADGTPDANGTPDASDAPAPTEDEKRDQVVDRKLIDQVPDREVTRKEITEMKEKAREDEDQEEKKNHAPSDDGQDSQRKSLWPKKKAKAPEEPKTPPSTTPSVPDTEPKQEPKTDPSPKAPPSPTPAPPPSPKPKDEPAPKKPPKQEKPEEEKKPAPPSKTDPKVDVPADIDPNDNGIDPAEQKASDEYAGPKEAVYHPQSGNGFELSEMAAQLAAMSKKDYLKLQSDVVDSKYPACNYFVITALFQAKVVDEDHIPLFTAAAFPKKYLEPKGWKKVDLRTAAQMMRDGKTFDIIIQKAPPKGKTHGHIAIPVGLNKDGLPLVAEAALGSSTNRIRVVSLNEIQKYSIYVRTP